jgi:sugar/nucleoside kinase (ribokinase family)
VAENPTTIDVVGIGNAIVDVISVENDAFVETYGLVKQSMTLIDAERAVELYGAMSPAIETSGGSAANTVAGVAAFGGRAGFIGKVRNDQLGEVFAHDIRSIGVRYDGPVATDGPPTARSLIVVTPDAARTMNTFLGSSSLLLPDEIDTAFVAGSRVLFCEGYIWDVDITKEAIMLAVGAAKDAGRKISFTLSDSFCVERHHAEWLRMVDDTIDILFANEHEITTLYETDDFFAALDQVRGRCEIACLTRGPLGSLIVTADEVVEIPPAEVEVVDTTGAGDLYASGFLYGYTQGWSLDRCGALGSLAASEVISQVGARPSTPLAPLLDQLQEV